MTEDINGNDYRMQRASEYKQTFEPLFRYIPYFSQKEGSDISAMYKGDGDVKLSAAVPTYDSTVLSFVKDAQRTGAMDRNHIYTYKRLHIRNSTDERLIISNTTLKDFDNIIAIMSHYVLGGMTKGILWKEAVMDGVWLHCLLKMKELVSVYDAPTV